MHNSNIFPVGAREIHSYLNNERILPVLDGEPKLFLRKPIGAFLPKDNESIENIKQKAYKILNLKLAPWQRLDCMRTFFYPSLQFLMRTNQLDKKDWTRINKDIRPYVKKTLNLQLNAVKEYLYGFPLVVSLVRRLLQRSRTLRISMVHLSF